ncbi:MAG: hypothetical protein GY714_04525 [Desulfobacterales bacterium]|nr:hypothetical protein [Desulfobacterales bacterium]
MDQISLKNFVEDAYKDIILDWDNLLDRYNRGDVDDSEKFTVEGNHRMNLIFYILSNNSIEKYSGTSTNQLSLEISQQTNFDKSFIKKTLDSLIDNKLLTNNEALFWSH